MRSAQKSNRSRGRGNRKGNGNNVNRVYESNGPEGKVRGTPQQIYEKYVTLARDSQTAGDRVTAENFLQHAEHYQRILTAAAAAQQERRDAANGESRQEEESDAPAAEAPQQPSADTNGRAPAAVESVGGMTTIDSDGGRSPDLLVTTDDPVESQPRKRRNNGRARAEPEESAEETPTAPEKSAD